MAITRLGGANAISGTIPQGNIANASLGAVTALPAAIATGSVLQVVQAITTTAVTHTSDGGQVDTGLTASITPSATSSKILVLISQSNKVERGSATSLEYDLRLFRDSTEVEKWTNVCAEDVTNDAKFYGSNHAYHFQDSPSSTSSITFKTTGQIVSSGGGRTVAFQNSSAPSTMTLMEIAG
jgi:hypothetical protein